MKINSIFITIFFLLVTHQLQSSIDNEIDAMQQAPVSERFKRMNELKKKIIKMREKERLKILNRLQQIYKIKLSNKTKKSIHYEIQNGIGEMDHDKDE